VKERLEVQIPDTRCLNDVLTVLAKQHCITGCFTYIFHHGALVLKNNGRLLNTMWINEGNSTVCVVQGSGEITRRILSGLNIRKFITLLTLLLLRL